MLRARVYPTLWQTALVDRHGVQQQPQQQQHVGPATIAAICKSTIRGLGFSTTSTARRGRFGGAVDIIVVEQKDGSLKSTPWYVQFAKFQSLLRQNSRSVAVSVNDADAGFQMYLNRWGTPYLLKDGEACSFAGSSREAEGDEAAQRTERLVRKWYSRRWYDQKKLESPSPSSDQLAALGLKEGRNKVSFTVTSPLLGRRQIDASIFLMKWDAKLIISDVDGTITKSDVLGQFMPLVGRDWSQTGVALLFSAIKNNGYKLVFLSARAITQANQTREFLANLMQDGEKLPDGPVILSPEGIFPSLYREVICRNPHEFKIACLQQIREAFPSDCSPFYAGFGNRPTDVVSYLKVGVHSDRIFTIDPRGVLVANNNAVDVTCYTSLHKLVDRMFPALPGSASGAADDSARC